MKKSKKSYKWSAKQRANFKRAIAARNKAKRNGVTRASMAAQPAPLKRSPMVAKLRPTSSKHIRVLERGRIVTYTPRKITVWAKG